MTKKIVFFLVSLVLHLVSAAVILAVFWTMAKWYFDANPLWGVDFYYTATLTNLIKSNLALPPQSWNYAWFAGWPNFSSHPILHYYLIIPFTYFFDLLSSVKIWMLVSLGFFILGIYAACFALSRNRGLAIILSIAGIYSVGVYGALMWGGSLPNHASQSFYPWTLFLIIQYLRSRNIRWLLGAGLLAGISILGHPQITIAYIFPSCAILFLFSIGQMKLIERIKGGILFGLIALVVGMPVLYTSASSLKTLVVTDALDVASSTARVDGELSQDIKDFHLAQPKRIYTDTNKTIFILLGLSLGFFLVSLIFRHRKKELIASIPFVILAIFYTVYIHLFAYGISIYHGGWYRLFWSVPVWMGLLIAAWWGTGEGTFKETFGRFKFVVSPILTVGVLIIGAFYLNQYSSGVKERIIPRSNPSSAFPDVVNMRADKAGFERLKHEMVPQWLDASRIDYRMYDGDQTVNIWWNALYKMPLARGYFDPPTAPALGYRFWVDAALSVDKSTGEDQLVTSFDYPTDIAFNNTLFLIDWYAIKFYEGGRGGPTTFAPLPTRLVTEDKLLHLEELDFNKEKYNTGGQTLKYYELKDELISPIFMPTNAPVLGIFATDQGYETIIRALADANLGVNVVIPVKLGPQIDKLSSRDLSDFDALFLYDYKYQNKSRAFNRLKDYVQSGGKLYVDTGVEVGESDAVSLPEVFPVENTYRKPLGREWQLKNDDARFGQGVDFSAFDPPVFDDAEWKLSYPRDSSDIRAGSEVVLTHGDYPLMVTKRLGEGEVVWSGLNLPYHVIRFHNAHEVVFFTNIINQILPPQSDSSVSAARTQFISAQKRTITAPPGVRGVLLKEQNYSGWLAKINTNNQRRNIKIWSAGPAYPGFMYVHIPKSFSDKETVVTFSYYGSPLTWFFSILSFITVVYILEYSLLGGPVLTRATRWVIHKIKKRTKLWWVKEDEE